MKMLFWMNVVLIFTWCPFGIESARFLHFQPYITAEIASSLQLRFSWNGTEHTTSLTLHRVNNGTSTNVLDIEGKRFVFKNNWAGRTAVEITFDNSTGLFGMTLNLRDVAVEDEGVYKLHVYEGKHVGAETWENTGQFRIQTYARPTNLKISYAENSLAMFTCTGNAGRPLGKLKLVQSNGLQNGGFRTIATVEPNMIQKKEHPNGTFSLFYTFQVTLTHLEEKSRFKCRITSDVPDFTVTDSGAIKIPFAATVSQVQISINPQEVVLGSSSPVSTTFTCTISSSASITVILSMQILRKRENDLKFEVVGQVFTADIKPAFAPTAPQDIASRGAMSGGIDVGTPTASTLTLTMSTQDVVCMDKGDYQCKVVYQETSSDILPVQSNGTLSIYALPYDVSLSARKNNMIIQGTSPGDSAAIVNVGETVEFTCSAKIGSDNTTKLRWKRTSEIGGGNFIPYQQDDIDDGTSSSMEIDCSYTRTATLRYNVTLSDANPNYDLAFQCYVSVDPPGQGTVETQNPPTFYINAINPNVAPNQDKSTADDGGSDVGAIAGGVIGAIVAIVLIVLLVYFLWYRKRGDGSTYRTKEETGEQNPNMVSGAPVDQTYAVPNKEKKKGHENRGLDERHTNRSRDDDDGYTGRRSRDNYDDIDDDHHYNNNSRYSRDRVGGRANRALDHDDDYSRDGSPTINHMGLDPESGSYGTGV